MLERFFRETEWRPTVSLPVAGALPYSKFGFFKRLLMKRVVAGQGGPTDTTRDYVFTDWDALERFVEAFSREIPLGAGARAATAD